MQTATKATDKALVRRLINQVNERLTELVPGQEYPLEAILGPDYWQDEDDSHLALGHFFSMLVGDNRVPFVTAGWSSNRHNKYRYTP